MLDFNTDHIGHAGGIQKVLAAGAELAVVIIFPVLHEDADHIMALLFEQIRSNCGIYAAGQANDYTVLGHSEIMAVRPQRRAGAVLAAVSGVCFVVVAQCLHDLAIAVV